MESTLFRALLIGDASTREMQPVADGLAELSVAVMHANCVNRWWVASGDGEPSGACPFPELVVVCQSWSDEFPRPVVESLFAAWPLARFVCCYGAWCCSDGRTRSVWPLAVRVPAEVAPARIRRELAVVRGEIPPLPWTASRDEIFAFDHADRVVPHPSHDKA